MPTQMIKKILLAGLLSAAVLVPVAAQRNSDSFAEEITDECVFPNLELPDEFVVYAAGWYSSSRQLDFQIDQSSGETAVRMDLVVNSPSKPVVLMLGRYMPTIYNIKWTKDTDIVAVVASGYYRQAVAGLPDETPILISTDTNSAKCGYFHKDPYIYGYEEIDFLSQKLFGQLVEKVKVEDIPSKLVGEPLEDEDPKLFSSDDTSVDSFYDPTAPLAGEPALEAARKEGILRKATEEDAEAWIKRQQKLHPEEDVVRPYVGEFSKAYVILDDFTYPNGVNGARFFVPDDVPEPNGNADYSSIYDFRTGKCYGPLCNFKI